MHLDRPAAHGRRVPLTTGPEGRRRARRPGPPGVLARPSPSPWPARGWDVAITGRTRRAGEGRDHSDTGEGRIIPGSLEETEAAIRSSGSAALSMAADLHDRRSLGAAVDRVIADWGGVDLLVNNAVDTGPGSMVPILELPVAQLEAKFGRQRGGSAGARAGRAPRDVQRGSGAIVNVTSHTATADPPGPVGQGGWELGYAASKRRCTASPPSWPWNMARQGIRAFNLDPGYVETERQLVNAAALGFGGSHGPPGHRHPFRPPPWCGWPTTPKSSRTVRPSGPRSWP